MITYWWVGLGGFTTFSAFGFKAVTLLRRGDLGYAFSAVLR